MQINTINDDRKESRTANIVYKTFGSQWVIERFSPYQKYL